MKVAISFKVGWAIPKGALHVYSHTDYPILHKIFDLCPFMQTGLLRQNRIEDCCGLMPSLLKSVILSSSLPYQNSPNIQSYSDTGPIYFKMKDNFTDFHETRTDSPCIMYVQDVQYIGRVFSTSGGSHEYIGGYHEYIGGYHEYIGEVP